MWTFFIISSLCIGVSIVLLIRRYAGQGVEWVVKLATAYAWLTSMCIVALAPLDVWTTLAQITAGRPFVGVLWSISYWSTQLATWLVLPFYQVYSEAGDFSVKERAWTSIRENALLYGTIGALGIIGIAGLLIIHAVDITGLMGLGVGLSNAFGLIVGLLLMGYGLIEIPRQVWKGSNPETSLKWAAHRSGRFAEDVMRARVELRDVVTIIYANQRQMRRHDPLQRYMEVVFEEAEKESPIKPSELASRTVDIDHLRAEDLEYNYDKAGLAALRRRLRWAIWDYKGAHARYADVVIEALEWEQVVKARSTGDFTKPPHPNPRTTPKVWDNALWVYDTRVRTVANRVFAAILVGASACIVWGEITIPVHSVDLSPFSRLIKGTEADDEFFAQLFTLLPLVYICASMYYTLFRINAFNYNKLIKGATTGAALMQNGSLMCRFAAPTCWNFYHIIRMAKDSCAAPNNKAQPDGSVCYKTVFDEKMASLSVLPPALNLNKYLPVILGVMCGITALDMWDKLLNCCTKSRYRFSTDDLEDEYTEKGRLLLRKEAEALAAGYKVGDTLATSYVDLAFPLVRGMERDPAVAASAGIAPSKGLFSGLWGRSKQLDPEVPPPPQQVSSAAAPAASRYTSSAAQTASRWLTGRTGGAAAGPGPTPAPTSGAPAATLELPIDNPRLSLLGSRMDNSSLPDSSRSATPGGGGCGAGGSGLDGIFAGLMRGGGNAGSNTGSNTGGPPPGSRAPAKSDLDALLSGSTWSRSG